MAAWLNANGTAYINDGTLRRARLVLGWVTMFGLIPGAGQLGM